ncbi:MAG: DsbA family protein [Hyphomicrobiaceae bacterium]|nr:DsbA family protein [Hyphomicrobiaceae bacterium]
MAPINLLDALASRKSAAAGAAVLLALGLLSVGSAPAVSTENSPFSPEQKQAIERIVKDYLLQNPEVMIEVGQELEKRQAITKVAEQKRVIVENRGTIFAAPTDFVMGNPNGDITVVEFFDYNCGWCKRAVDELSKLAKADGNVKIIFKEFPIFGENSTLAAKAAMASLKQGKYWEFHLALMKERQVTKENVFKIADKAGLDLAKLKADMASPEFDAAIKSTSEIAQALGIEGTPGFIVDAKVNVGYLPVDGLKQLIAEARKAGCQVC